MTRGLIGAVVYPARNSRRKALTLRVNGKIVAYEAHDKKWNRLTFNVHGREDRKGYKMEPLFGGPSIDVVGIPSKQIWSKPTAVYEVNNVNTPVIGKSLTWEDRHDAGGEQIMQCDSTGMFQEAAWTLMQMYPGTLPYPFQNMHDDKSDKGSVEDSLKSFLEAMREIPSNLDFFVYCGHGDRSVLPSAGLSLGHNVKTKGGGKHWEDSAAFVEFIDILKKSVKPTGKIIFYACTAGIEDGFAQAVSARIPSVTVYGHTKAGRAKQNPYKATMKAGLHQRYSALLGDADWAEWAERLDAGDKLWATYWNMTVQEIKDYLHGKMQLAA